MKTSVHETSLKQVTDKVCEDDAGALLTMFFFTFFAYMTLLTMPIDNMLAFRQWLFLKINHTSYHTIIIAYIL